LTARTGDHPLFSALCALVESTNIHDVDSNAVEVESCKHALQLTVSLLIRRITAGNCATHLGVSIDVQSGTGVKCRDGRNVVVLSLSLLLLELEGDATNRALLDTLHQVRGEAGDFVAQALGRDFSNLIDDALVGVEVEGEAGVVLFDEYTGGALCRLRTNSSLNALSVSSSHLTTYPSSSSQNIP